MRTDAREIAALTELTMIEVERRIRTFCEAEGVALPSEEALERMLEPLRYQLATMHTDDLERVRGRH